MWRLQPKQQQRLKFLDLLNSSGNNIWFFLLLSFFIHVLIFLLIFLYKQTGLIIIDSGNLPVYYNFRSSSISKVNSSRNFNSNFYKRDTIKQVKEILDNSIVSHDTNSFIKLGKKNNKISLNSKKIKNKNKKLSKKNNKSLQKIKNLKKALKKLELHEAEKNNNLKPELEKAEKTKNIDTKDTQKSENNLNNKDLINQADILSEQINIGSESISQEFPLNGYLMTDMNLVNDIRSAVGKNWSKPKGFPDIACEFKILVSCDGQSVTILEQKNSKVPAFNIQAKGAILNTKFPDKCWGKELNLILR